MSAIPRRVRVLLLLALAASLLAFLQFFKSPGQGKLWLAAMDAGHVPLFGVFALVALGIVRAFRRDRANHPLLPYALAFAITAFVSALCELLQFYGPRDANIVDLARSLAGAWIFLSVVVLFDKTALPPAPRRRRLIRAILGILVIGLLGASFARLALLAWARAA